MKAMLIILIVTRSGYGFVTESTKIPMKDYQHCVDQAELVGAAVASGLGTYAVQVTTECVNQGE